MNKQIASNEIESVIEKLPTDKSPGPYSFTGEFYQTENTLSLLKLLQKIVEERMHPISFYKARK